MIHLDFVIMSLVLEWVPLVVKYSDQTGILARQGNRQYSVRPGASLVSELQEDIPPGKVPQGKVHKDLKLAGHH